MRRWILAVLAVLAPAALAPAAATAAPELPPGVQLVDGYIPHFDQKRRMNERFRRQFDALREQVLRRGAAGEHLPCSSQILEEVDWLIGSTADEARTLRRLEDLRASLERPLAQQASAAEQTASDGSWGECYEAWFLRLQSAVDPLKELVARGARPNHPLAFLGMVDSPAKITEHFRRLLTSRVLEDGVDHRKELNLTVASLGQLLFLPELAGLFPPSWPRAEVAAALIAFMDKEWQDPQSGYWGAWYRIGDRVIKTDDLSITFHIASYRGGRIERLPELVRTVFRTRDRPYPYGWQDRGTQNCHHVYDVVRLVRLGWPLMTPLERAFSRTQLAMITARTVRLSINPVGEVDVRPYNRVAEAYYFCVSLLDDLGYFRRSRNFWSDFEFDEAKDLQQQLLRHLQSLPQADPMVSEARRKLQARD